MSKKVDCRQPAIDSRENNVHVLKSIQDAEELLRFLKLNFLNVEEIEFSFKISWGAKATEKKDIRKLDTKDNFEDDGFNPVTFYRKSSKKELEGKLYTFDINILKNLARKYTPDPRGYLYRWKDKGKIIDYIIDRIVIIAEAGDVFYSK